MFFTHDNVLYHARRECRWQPRISRSNVRGFCQRMTYLSMKKFRLEIFTTSVLPAMIVAELAHHEFGSEIFYSVAKVGGFFILRLRSGQDQLNRNSLVLKSFTTSLSLAAFSNSNFLAASRMSDSRLLM